MNPFHDWRVLAIGTAVLWGVWGFFAKAAATRLDWRTALMLVVTANFVVISFATLRDVNWTLTRWHAAAVLAGVFGSLGSILMYQAFNRGPGGPIIAISAQYVLITTFLSWALLGEHLKPRQVLGVLLGVVAIILITWKDAPAADAAPAASQRVDAPASPDAEP